MLCRVHPPDLRVGALRLLDNDPARLWGTNSRGTISRSVRGAQRRSRSTGNPIGPRRLRSSDRLKCPPILKRPSRDAAAAPLNSIRYSPEPGL